MIRFVDENSPATTFSDKFTFFIRLRLQFAKSLLSKPIATLSRSRILPKVEEFNTEIVYLPLFDDVSTVSQRLKMAIKSASGDS